MSERPDADTGGVKIGTPPKTTTPPPPPKQDHPHSYSPPGPDIGDPFPPDPPKQSWSGSDHYPDGYTMARQPDGTITLTNPNGQSAWWSEDAHGWYDADGNRKPDDWSGGHAPTTQTYTTGPSSSPGAQP